MDWAGKSHPLEVLADWGAPMVLAAAAAWAASISGLPMAAMVSAFTIALVSGVVAMRMAGGAPLASDAGFEPVSLESCSSAGELLLDDPLLEVAEDSRIVQLFARQDPTPGELVLRISDYLNDSGRAPVADNPPGEPGHVDASAALHAALANIRASLR